MYVNLLNFMINIPLNIVWGRSKPYRWIRTIFRGFPLGAACAAATIAYEEYYGVYKHHGHDAHGEHGGGGHH